MLALSYLAAFAASSGWATGTVLADRPARALGSFAFIRIQVIACAALQASLCSVFSLWSTVSTAHWPAFAVSTGAMLVGLLSFTTCLRMGGPRRAEVVFSLRALVVAAMAYIWLGETLSTGDAMGGLICLSGVLLAILSRHADGEAAPDAFKNAALFMGIGLMGVTCQGLSFLAVKPALESGTHPLAVSAIQLGGASAIVTLAALLPVRALKAQTRLTPYLMFRTVLPGIIGYVFASSALLFAFATLEAGVAAVLGSLAPVLVIPIQAVRDREYPGAKTVVGAAIAVIGASIIVLV